jgi:hypothetical protein
VRSVGRPVIMPRVLATVQLTLRDRRSSRGSSAVRVLFASIYTESRRADAASGFGGASGGSRCCLFVPGADAVAQAQSAGIEAVSAGLRSVEVRRRYAAFGAELAGLSPQQRVVRLGPRLDRDRGPGDGR